MPGSTATRARNARRLACRHSRRQPSVNFTRHVFIERRHLHCLRIALHVHKDDVGAPVGDNAHGGGIARKPAYVIDDRRTGIETGSHGRRVPRIDGDRDPGRRQFAHHRKDAAQFCFRGYWCSAGPRRLAAHIDHIRSVGDQRVAAANRGNHVARLAAIRKAVGGDVDDPHQPWPVKGDAGKSRWRPAAPVPRFRHGYRRRRIASEDRGGY